METIAPMKEAFLRCMKYMYPVAVENDRQVRDLIKVFSMGYIEGLERVGADREKMAVLVGEVKAITDFNWWPDNSWRWWLH